MSAVSGTMELLDWDESHRYEWKWLCLHCEKEGVVMTRIIASALHRIEKLKQEHKVDVVPITCAHCNADALIIEKVYP